MARLQDRAIVASHAYNTVIDLNGVKEVLKSDQLSVRPGVHFSFASGGSAWHLMSDVEGRIFILISERAYPVRAAHACLEEFQRSVCVGRVFAEADVASCHFPLCHTRLPCRARF